ncbi:hypothetical protein EDB82DRAFT_518052 [Fusarium venenatum]|uniref:uncharacterized protein n=1 Tax=Fusarium venenatum TaxID=56646 RepID=UPI001E129E5A|nr:hypothetical protein EDB82DRAFT_518052 [Fusarium venenatum]
MIAPVLKLAFSLAPASGTLTWVNKFVQTTTASQRFFKGKSMDQSISDGAAWLHGFYERRKDLATLVDQQNYESNSNSQIQEASANGVQKDCIALIRLMGTIGILLGNHTLMD